VNRRAAPVLAVVATVAIVAGGAQVLRGLTASEADVAVLTVERGDFVRNVWTEGNLQAVDATLLGPPAEVRRPLKIAWLAPDGSPVKQGDVVVRFDPTELEQDLREGRYDRQTADSRITHKSVKSEGNLRNLERDSELATLELDYAENFQSNDKRIFSRNQIVESEIDRDLAQDKLVHAERTGEIQRKLDRAELDLLEIERRKADLKVDQAEQGMRGLEVRAPHDGIFVIKSVWGRKPEIGQVVWGGQPVAELPKLDEMEARIYVLEADAGGLEVGIPASVVLDAHPDMVFKAEVANADALAQRRDHRSPVQYFGVTLRLERTDSVMKPGQRVQAQLKLDELHDVLSVPRQAVQDRDGARVVYRRNGAGFEPVDVTLGPAGVGRVVIEEGLEAGDVIALRDPTRAPDDPAEDEAGPGSAPVNR